MAIKDITPYPVLFPQYIDICKRRNIKKMSAVKDGYITRDDYNNLKRGRFSASLGRNLFFYLYDLGLKEELQ